MDDRMCAAVEFVKSEGGEVHADDTRLEKWSNDGDRSGDDDTLNRCFSARVLFQVQIDDDDFVIRTR